MNDGRYVELREHDPGWSALAAAEIEVLFVALGPELVMAEHVGSTAIAAIRAKPVIDLVAGIQDIAAFDPPCPVLVALGYDGLGENGLSGRRFFIKVEPGSGRRLVHLHVYQAGSPEIVRHLAFRDYLRANPVTARAYEREKLRCHDLHADDRAAYSLCKSDWIRTVEADALAWLQERNQVSAADRPTRL